MLLFQNIRQGKRFVGEHIKVFVIPLAQFSQQTYLSTGLSWFIIILDMYFFGMIKGDTSG
jgi:hypothetical protein